MNVKGKRILVFGSGISGIGAAGLLEERGAIVTLYDGKEKELERIGPYMDLVHICLDFVKANINKPLSAEKLAQAEDIENQIDAYRKQLKKIARKNLEKGSNVKTELLYLDLIRHIEKIGDHAFSISESLSQTK